MFNGDHSRKKSGEVLERLPGFPHKLKPNNGVKGWLILYKTFETSHAVRSSTGDERSISCNEMKPMPFPWRLYNQRYTIVHSTEPHNATLLSDQRLVRKGAGLRPQCRMLHFLTVSRSMASSFLLKEKYRQDMAEKEKYRQDMAENIDAGRKCPKRIIQAGKGQKE